MKALCWQARAKVSVDLVNDPVIQDPTDMIIKVRASGICGSDLHLYDGYVPAMEKGDILGHEAFGEVVETGKEVRRFRIGDRVAVPFNISCGVYSFCKQELYSLCDRSNPNAEMAAKIYEYSPGVYSGFIDKYPIGAFFNQGLTLRGGQTHVHKYLPRLLQLVLDGKIKPMDVVSHHIRLEEAPEYYRIFRDKENECLKTIVRF